MDETYKLYIEYQTRYVPVFDEYDSNTQTDITWRLYPPGDDVVPMVSGKTWYSKTSHDSCTKRAGEEIDNLLAILKPEVEIIDLRADTQH